jgi:hypothetical protein
MWIHVPAPIALLRGPALLVFRGVGCARCDSSGIGSALWPYDTAWSGIEVEYSTLEQFRRKSRMTRSRRVAQIPCVSKRMAAW